MRQEYHIEIAHYDLKIPYADELFLGRNASHSFLRLVNDDGKVIEEIHGGAYDHEKKKLVPYKFKLNDFFNRKANVLNSDVEYGLAVEIRTTETPKNKVDHVDRLVSGTREDVLKLWDQCKEKAEIINQKNLRYIALPGFRFAQNCHSVVNTIANHIGVPYDICHRTHKFALPGIKTCLKTIEDTTPKFPPIEFARKAISNAIDKYATNTIV